MVIIETQNFTRRINGLISDDEYSQLQAYLVAHPEAGDSIKGSGGIRKVRWAISGRGKSGGIRVIYYWIKVEDAIYMLSVYPKNEKADLTPSEIKDLRRIVEEEIK